MELEITCAAGRTAGAAAGSAHLPEFTDGTAARAVAKESNEN